MGSCAAAAWPAAKCRPKAESGRPARAPDYCDRLMPDHVIPEQLVSLLHSVSEDRRLAEWLLGLPQHPPAARQAALLLMAAEMRAGGEDSAVADAITALAQPHFFEAACNTLRELGP